MFSKQGYQRCQLHTPGADTNTYPKVNIPFLTLSPCDHSHFTCNRGITHRPVTYVWANSTDTVSSHIKIYSVQVRHIHTSIDPSTHPYISIHPSIHPSIQVNQQIALKDLGTIVLSSCVARSIIFVPGTSGGVAQTNSDNPLRCDLVRPHHGHEFPY